MTRLASRLLIATLALIALIFLSPLAAALPPDARVLSPAERPEAAPGLFSQLWGFLSALWSENGSGLEPDGGAQPGANPSPGPTGASDDNGSGLDPNG